jgi:hypothetical protein
MEEQRYYGVYERVGEDEWIYPWGEPVPGARCLTVADVLRLGRASPGDPDGRHGLLQELGDDPVVCELHSDDDGVRDKIVGFYAPELHASAMLTISDVAELLGVAPDTVAAYRYRGYLPEPQALIGRTPVWSRPVVHHWIQHRPGNGWRTDLYGDRAEYLEREAYMREARRSRRQAS